MNKNFRFILFMLSFVIIASFTSCRSDVANEEFPIASKSELDPKKIGYYSTLKLPIDNKNTEISIIVTTSGSTDLTDTIIVKELSRRTGLKIKTIPIPTSTISTKIKTILASKTNLPDIINGIYNVSMTNDFGIQGAFEPVNEHINEMPNLKEIFYSKTQKHGTAGVIERFIAQDGNLYLVPKYDIEREVNHGMLYRKDIFDKHDIPMWNSTEEFYNAMKKLKSIYPNSTPFTSKAGFLNRVSESWGIKYPNPYYDEETKMWKHSVIDEKFKDFLDFTKKLYDEKLLDPEFLTNTQASWTSKMTQRDKAFVTFDWIGRLDMFKEQTAESIPEYDLRYAYPIGPTGKVITLEQVKDGPAVAKGKNSTLALKLLDYLISPSGAQLMTMGIEGETYELDDNGMAKYIGFPEGTKVDINKLQEKYGLFTEGLYRRMDRRSVYFNLSEKEQEAQDLMKNKPGGGFLPEDPVLVFTSEEQEIINEYTMNISKAAEEFATNYILSNNYGLNEWNSWLEKAQSLGINKVIEIYNEAQKRIND